MTFDFFIFNLMNIRKKFQKYTAYENKFIKNSKKLTML